MIVKNNEGTLGDLIRKKRLYLDLSMEDVASEAGISKEHLWKIERNKYQDFSMGTATALANVLKIDLREFKKFFTQEGKDD